MHRDLVPETDSALLMDFSFAGICYLCIDDRLRIFQRMIDNSHNDIDARSCSDWRVSC